MQSGKKIINDNIIIFFQNSIDDYCTIQNYFDNSKFEFFDLTIKSERRRKFILQGIPKDIPIDEIKNELVILGFSVHSFVQLKYFKTKLPLPIFLVNRFPSSNFAPIFDTKLFPGFLITVKTYHFKLFIQFVFLENAIQKKLFDV